MKKKKSNIQNTKSVAIFVHSLFRAGSTYFYNVLKRTGSYHTYHEPMHEVIATLSNSWAEHSARSAQLKATLRHDFLSGGYFDEYAHLLPSIKKTFRLEICFDHFFMGGKDNASELKAYIDTLIDGAHNMPVFQCTRSIGRINWFRTNYQSKHVFLLRNPWDQWYSYKVDNYISSTPRVIYSQPNLPEVLRTVMFSQDLSPLPGADIQAKLDYAFAHPIPPEADYCLFFGLWVYAFLTGKRDCDVFIDMDEVSSNENYRTKILKVLAAIGLKSIDLSDAHLHRAFFTEREKDFYQIIEDQVLEIYRQHDFDIENLNSVREYLQQQRDVAFVTELNEATGVLSTFEDAKRMREVLLSSGQHVAAVVANLSQAITERDREIASHNQDMVERDEQIARLNQTLAERDEQIASLNQAMTEHDGQITSLNQAVAERDGEIASLNQAVANRDGQIASLNQAMTKPDGKIENLSQVLSEHIGQIASLNQTVVERDGKIDSLSQAVSKRDEKIASLNQEVADRDRQIINLNQTVAEHDGQIASLNQDVSDRDRQIVNLNQTLAEHDDQIASLNQAVIDRDGQIVSLNQAVADRDDQIASLIQAVEDRDGQIAGLNQDIVERESQIGGFNQALADRDGHIASLNKAVADRDGQITNLTQALTERDTTIQAMKSSRSWRVTAPLRALSGFIKGNKPMIPEIPNEQLNQVPGAEAFFTICSKNFLAHARVLHNSIRPHYPRAKFFVVLCDRIDGLFDPAQEPFEFIYLEDLRLPNLDEMATRYNITEFNTAVKPFAFTHLMEKHSFNSVIYLDPDLLFIDKMCELDKMLQEGAEAILTPHILEPAEHDEVHDGKMLLYGVYNLGFLALRNTPSVKSFLMWWGRKLERDCVIRLEEGLFVDQKWADLLPAFVPGTRVLHHPGYNVAYWNLPQRKVTKRKGAWFSNEQPLRFVHFSGNKLDDKKIFSRHSQQVTVENIGDLKELLDYYRDEVYKEGHEYYRKLPYAFSWDGVDGINLHTPKELDMAKSDKNLDKVGYKNDTPDHMNTVVLQDKRGKLGKLYDALIAGSRLSGGWGRFTIRLVKSFRKNGWKHVKAKARELAGYELLTQRKRLDYDLKKNENLNKGKLLYFDWDIPRPDKDAASVTAVQLMKIFMSQGFSVTFIPCSLKYQEDYFEALSAEGVEVICYPKINSLKDWIKDYAAEYSICVLARGPVVWPYLSDLRTYAPNTRLLFNTVDLHYLRELRQAELSNNSRAIKDALELKGKELNLIKECDMTILLSKEELYKVREELPGSSLAVLPLVFDDMPGSTVEYEHRKDILFIGSFPHEPNIDAVLYFVNDIFPIVKNKIPDVKFKIVGSNPPKEIEKLALIPDVEVLGFVKDIAPIFEKIRLTIAPLRYGAGIKGKIGTSFSYGVPCVATTIAVEGMGLTKDKNILIEDSNKEFANSICNAYLNKSVWEGLSREGFKFANENYSVSAISDRVNNIITCISGKWKPMQSLYEIDGWDEFQRHRDLLKSEYERRSKIEFSLLPDKEVESFKTSGFCCVCGKETNFITSFMYSTETTNEGITLPNWREHLQCEHCGLNNRMRAALNALHTLAPPEIEDRIYITEQVTPMYRWLQDRYKNIHGSEYMGAEYISGTLVEGINHEDVMGLSFSDSSFDRVLSLDVLENFSDPEKAFREIYRVLDDGGVFLFSVPFSADSSTDIIRATLSHDGEIEHHLPAGYHRNPVDSEGGALCFRYFGWELLDELRSIGFSRVRVLAYWSEYQGYLGREQYLFIAQKPSRDKVILPVRG